ncbi:MAG: ribonuclease P [Candidatus Altiarchaeales archaeon ex4484_96]|nr:MAG: ribonuclease P [Candidatus Altiarchaeales archaeon ex4484_96]
MSSVRRGEQKKIALERIKALFVEAEAAALKGDLDLANEHVFSAKKISSRTNTAIPSVLKRRYCRYCYHYLHPGLSSKVRTNPAKKRVEVSCLRCGRKNFYPYLREVKEKRQMK